MANVRITDLDLIPFSSITSDDVFPIVDIDADVTYKIDISGLTKYISSQANKWYIQSGETITVGSYSQKFIYGDLLVEGTLFLEENSLLYVINGNIELISGGTISGTGLYYMIDIPLFDTFVTGGTFNQYSGTTIFVNNSGNTFTIEGYTIPNYKFIPSGETITIQSNTQKFIYGDLLIEGNVFLEDDSELFVLNGNIELINNGQITGTGKTQIVSIPEFDKFVTGGTFNVYSGITTFTNSSGESFSIGGFTTPNFKTIPSGETITIPSNTQKFIYGDLLVQGNFLLEDDSEIVVLNGNITIDGGSINGSGIVRIVELPEVDTFLTGGTFNIYSGITTFNDNFGGTFDIGNYTTPNFKFIPSGVTVNVPLNTQKFIYGDLLIEGILHLEDDSELFVLNGNIELINDGVITGSGLTHIVSLPEIDTFITGGTYNPYLGSTTFVDNFGGNFLVTGFTVDNYIVIPSGVTVTVPSYTQKFVYGDVLVFGELNLENDSQLFLLNGDLYVSGGTLTGSGDIYTVDLPKFDTKVTAITYSNNSLTIYDNSGNTFNTEINTMTGLTVNGILSATTIQAQDIDLCGTNGTLYTDQISGCSPINMLSETYFQQGLSATTISGDTFYGDGSNLTNVGGEFTGGTVSGDTFFESGLSATTFSATTYLNIPSSPITVGTTPIVSGTTGRILFEGSGNVIQEDLGLDFNSTTKKLSVTSTYSTPGGSPIIDVVGSGINVAPQVRIISDGGISDIQLIAARTSGGGSVNATSVNRSFLYLGNAAGYRNVIASNDGIAFSSAGPTSYDSANDQMRLMSGNLAIGTNYSPSARLDVKAQGALSSDIGLRLRNSTDNANIFKVAGNGNFTIGLDSSYHVSFDPTSPSLRGRSSDGSTVAWQLSNWSNENCWITNNPSGQVLVGIGTATPTDKFHIYSTVNDYKIKISVGAGTPTDESCGIKFSTTWAGTAFGSDVVQIIARSKGSASTTSQKSSLEFLLNSGGTTSLRASITSQSNLLLQSPTEDTNDKGVIYVPNGVAPTGSTTDGYKQYSSDIVAGNAAPHFRTEDGSIIKLYQETTSVGSAVLNSGGGATITDTDTFGGYTLQQVVQALKNLGVLQ